MLSALLAAGAMAVLQPSSFASPSGAWVWRVEPCNPDGAGQAYYRVEHMGAVWGEFTGDLALWRLTVTDAGEAVGFGFTRGAEAGEVVNGAYRYDGSFEEYGRRPRARWFPSCLGTGEEPPTVRTAAGEVLEPAGPRPEGPPAQRAPETLRRVGVFALRFGSLLPPEGAWLRLHEVGGLTAWDPETDRITVHGLDGALAAVCYLDLDWWRSKVMNHVLDPGGRVVLGRSWNDAGFEVFSSWGRHLGQLPVVEGGPFVRGMVDVRFAPDGSGLWAERGDELYGVDVEGQVTAHVRAHADGRWLARRVAFAVAADGSLAVASDAEEDHAPRHTLSAYDPDGTPRWSRVLSAVSSSLEVSWNGTWAAIRLEERVLLARGDRPELLDVTDSLPADVVASHPGFGLPPGRSELWLLDGRTLGVYRYALPD